MKETSSMARPLSWTLALMAALALAQVPRSAIAAPAVVAIFDEPGFPLFAGSREVELERLADALRGAGVHVELVMSPTGAIHVTCPDRP